MNKTEFLETKIHLVVGDIIRYNSLIDIALSNSLCERLTTPNKIEAMMVLINMTKFKVKISVFEHLFKKEIELFENKCQDNFKGFLSKLKNIEETRNKLAHCIFSIPDLDDYSNVESFTLLKMGTKVMGTDDFKPTEYTFEKHKEHVILLKELDASIGIISNIKIQQEG